MSVPSLLLVAQGLAASAPMHPELELLDPAGVPVVQSLGPVSTMRSCGACHDTAYIEQHSSHVGVGLSDCAVRGTPGATGMRHTGGGDVAREVELDCFVCHLGGADMAARRQALMEGQGAWASTATMSATGLSVPSPEGGWAWDLEGLGEGGVVGMDELPLQPASSEACGFCHGQVRLGGEPVDLDLQAPCSSVTGQVFSDQLMSESMLNLAGKAGLTRPWDVHAASMVGCTACHHAANNPAFFLENEDKRPSHLRFDGRRLELGEYLERPNHQLAKGHSTQATADDRLDGSMRRCEDCHDPAVGHGWLPHRVTHQRALACEACHVPTVHAPARAFQDWTLPSPDGQPREGWRGVRGDPGDPASLIEGFQPILLTREDPGERARLFPTNLTVVWTWRDTQADEAVALERILRAVAPGGDWAPELFAMLDGDGDGRVTDDERVLGTPEQVAWVERALRGVGVGQPVVDAQLLAFGLHHGVVGGRWATRDCTVCHAQDETQLEQDLLLAERSPIGPLPTMAEGINLLQDGQLERSADGVLRYQAAGGASGLYVPGRPPTPWIARLGLFAVLGSLLGVGGHGTLRIVAHRRRGGRGDRDADTDVSRRQS